MAGSPPWAWSLVNFPRKSYQGGAGGSSPGGRKRRRRRETRSRNVRGPLEGVVGGGGRRGGVVRRSREREMIRLLQGSGDGESERGKKQEIWRSGNRGRRW